MSKKNLVLTASPRKNGNTSKMADAFTRGAEAAGHSVVRFDAAFHNIRGCNACNACWSKGNACVMDDDFNALAELLETCDVLLISTPLYWLGFPAQVKSAIDKLYAYGGSGGPRPLAIKESYLFVCGEDPTQEQYQPILQTYRTSAKFLGWEDRGILQIGGLEASGGIEASGVLEQAEEMGRNV